ncbi:MAG: SAM-dependent chlorinase/fluorinase [Acidimicrobiia bacterium]|nr:SAM-dependent chlorinase/fluorinase [Acidimicrobiia bacterium]
MHISFLSDFGLDDEFVGVVHGVVARIAPEVNVIDVTHGIGQGDVRGGALALLRAVQYLPEGVVLAVVDPGVGTDRRAIACRTSRGYFVGPDNGLLAPAVAMVGGADKFVALENPEFMLPSAGSTFHGRDIFGPAAAVLASGEATLDELGPEIPPGQVTPLLLPLVEHEAGVASGEIWWVDTFGNAQTNVSREDFEQMGLSEGDDVILEVGGSAFHLTWAAAYGNVEPGEALLVVDSHGQVAISVRGGSAVDDLPIDSGVAVQFRRSTRRPGPSITATG